MKNNFTMEKTTISPRQLAFLLLIGSCALRVIIIPSLIVQKANQNAYLSFAITAIVTLFMIWIVLKIIEKNKGKSFNTILEETFGKFVAKIILCLITIFFVFKVIITDFGMEGFLFESLYDEINWFIFIVPVFIVMSYMAFKGPRVIGRVAEIFLVFGIIALTFVTIISLPDIKFENILPIASDGFVPIINGSLTGFTLGGEYIFLLIFCENLETKKTYKKKCFIFASIILAFLCFFVFIFVSIFGNIAPFINDALTKISLFSEITNSTARLDSIIITLWLPLIIIYSAINIYCSAWCIKNLLKVKNTFACICVVLSFVALSKIIPQISVQSLLYASLSYFVYISAFLQILLPFAIYFSMKIKEKRRSLKLEKAKK